jgi:KaiC/GvpD/RAD55 family RecA-like ATPase
MELKKTGIRGLDEFLRGGLPTSVVLLVGSPEKGHEVFARQVTLFRSKTSDVTYFTVTKTQDAIKASMAAYGMDTTPLENEGKWKIVRSPKTLESTKTAIINEMKKNRCVVLDSLSELLLYHGIKEVADLVNSMIDQNRETQELHFVLLTKGMQDSKAEVALQHFADCVINFEASWKSEGLARNLMIQKVLGSTVPTQSIPYSLDQNGLTIETSTRIT